MLRDRTANRESRVWVKRGSVWFASASDNSPRLSSARVARFSHPWHSFSGLNAMSKVEVEFDKVSGAEESPQEQEYRRRYEGMDINSFPDRISDTFKNRNVLITGGSGFMGKVFIDKVLRFSPQIGHIYLLIRPKKGKEPKDRIHELFTSPLFDKLKKEQGADIVKKVSAIHGDVMQADLGLSATDRKFVQDTIELVYHMAATIRFDEGLRKAIILNTRGTKAMIDLCKGMKKLEYFCYVSTAYCHLEQKVLEEKAYPPLCNPHDVIKTVEELDDNMIEVMTPKILGTAPNTYAFSKNLAEALVVEAINEGFPASILRPSIVIPVWRDPLPGWTDNINGPAGLLIGAGKGVIRTMYCKQEGYADYVPVDIAASALMGAAWNFVYMKDHDRRFLHLTSSEEIRISWAELIMLGRKVMEDIPLNGIVWYPGGSMKTSRWVHNICAFFFHTIPAYFLDAIIFLAGHKPIMCRVQRRISKGFEVFEYYANNQWQFINTQVYHFRNIMNPRERANYKIDGHGLDIQKYFENCVMATRTYILKEMPDTLPAAKRHLRVMYWLDFFTKIMLTILFFYTMSKYFDIVHFVFYGLIHLVSQFFNTVTGISFFAN